MCLVYASDEIALLIKRFMDEQTGIDEAVLTGMGHKVLITNGKGSKFLITVEEV